MVIELNGNALLEQELLAQRSAVVRLCEQITGRADVAEDLAHEALLLAWRKLPTLRDSHALTGWLMAITRNVCRMWQRSQHWSRLELSLDSEDSSGGVLLETLAGDTDPFQTLDRRELISLVREALTLLPRETQSLLLAKYGAGLPTAVLADQLQLNESAISVRLFRGRQAARHIFATTLREAAIAADLPLDGVQFWRRTTLWCPHCGRQRLEFQLDQATGRLRLRCPSCISTPGRYLFNSSSEQVRGIQSYRSALTTLMNHASAFFGGHAADARASCVRCGSVLGVQHGCAGHGDAPAPTADHAPAFHAAVVYIHCAQCGVTEWAYRSELALYHPAGQRFWTRYRRIELAADQVVEYQGRSVLRTSYRQVDGAAQLEILTDPASHEYLHVVEPAN